ncbi:MAG: (E)-4-hydroxy-3-methylbut-2-enyl-diphosphate synthase [Spirochaetaceae bacterium]|jgi:(E)-4-hydroxy-3-methylbut-2-enyl-diphosphate synthase|nr:(E)-4-hydroxy-3-methylbut-2-enyl-diphosphate synthase [Spirochaetaceae bacterium]
MFNAEVIVGGFANVKAVKLGRAHPLVLQTMWKDRLEENITRGARFKKTISVIQRLEEFGCGLLRFAVPDMESAKLLGALASRVEMPLVADIHFDYKIALKCLDYKIAKIRINPGNIGSKEKIRAVLEKCGEKNAAVRIGVNAGSLPLDLRAELRNKTITAPDALVKAAERELAIFEENNFKNVVVSMKASSVSDTIQANRLFAARYKIPLHIGLTEAGPLIAGVARSAAALYGLLKDGVGDTVRVSLSDSMINELVAAKEIAMAAGRTGGIRVISCPRCGRCSFDTHAFTEKISGWCYTMNKNATVAVMGCAVNGPGEARGADIGITGAGSKVILFRHGAILKTVALNEAEAAFRKALEEL